MSDDEHNLAMRLRAQRQAMGLSTRKLARLAGLSHSIVVRAEQGQVSTPNNLARLATILRLDLAELYQLAGYAVPTTLPPLRPYVRLKYKELPTAAVDELMAFLNELRVKYSAEIDGPKPGADEYPDGQGSSPPDLVEHGPPRAT